MSKKEKVTGSVTASAVAKIGNVLCEAYRDKDSAGGNIALTMCDSLLPLIPEGGLGQADVDTIAAKVAKDRDWQADTAKSRKTEIKAVLTAPRKLATAIKTFTNETGFCGWTNVVSLARKLASGKTPTEAVADVRAKKKAAVIKTKEAAQKWTAIRIKGILKAECMEFMPKGFRKALIAFSVEHSLNVGSTA